MTRFLTTRFRPLTVALAIMGLIYALGVCPSGCLEANSWYALAHHWLEHDHASSACTHEGPVEHSDCDHEPDSALLVSGRSLDLAPLLVFWPPAPFEAMTSARPWPAPACDGPLSPREELSTATLRAQCQLFRC